MRIHPALDFNVAPDPKAVRLLEERTTAASWPDEFLTVPQILDGLADDFWAQIGLADLNKTERGVWLEKIFTGIHRPTDDGKLQMFTWARINGAFKHSDLITLPEEWADVATDLERVARERFGDAAWEESR